MRDSKRVLTIIAENTDTERVNWSENSDLRRMLDFEIQDELGPPSFVRYDRLIDRMCQDSLNPRQALVADSRTNLTSLEVNRHFTSFLDILLYRPPSFASDKGYLSDARGLAIFRVALVGPQDARRVFGRDYAKDGCFGKWEDPPSPAHRISSQFGPHRERIGATDRGSQLVR